MALFFAAPLAAFAYGLHLASVAAREFELRHWERPAQVYAAPLELYPGLALSADALAAELRRLGYRPSDESLVPGRFRRVDAGLELPTRAFAHAGQAEPERRLVLTFAGDRVATLATASGAPVALARLDPLLIGSLFATHGEDRLVVGRDEVPPLLTEALKAVEDRRFDRHRGIDLRGVARAALVNLRHGEIRQGASTLTQQLVRSFFLSNERSWSRKVREAWMALALELRYDKSELIHAYVNEVYLGQDGARAIHGFGLASQFYFGKPLAELQVHEVALLVGQVRGPAYYDPRRHPERARARRDLVLRQMAALGVIDEAQAVAAAAREIGVLPAAAGTATFHAAFLDLVRRQLRREYAAEDLARAGLRVFSTLEPAVQSAAEQALVQGLDALDSQGQLDGAVVVTRPQTGEVAALVGGRRVSYQGFNRALDARRPVGSLIKPVVYLAALESGSWSLSTLIDDAPIEVELPGGKSWSPANFDHRSRGPVPLLRALADSLNQATVRLGMEVGVEHVAELLARLGLQAATAPYPSLLLGAVELSPFEAAQVYTSLASGGFRAPLRAVHFVADADGGVLRRYPLRVTRASDPDAVRQINEALVQVMERGTGRSVRARLPSDVTVAGKTGTSDGERDSWFAGFTDDYTVVVWVGADDNRATGLTGASGAATVWARLVTELGPSAYRPAASPSLVQAWIDWDTGGQVEPHCAGAVPVLVPATERPWRARGCEGEVRAGLRLRERVRRWLRVQ